MTNKLIRMIPTKGSRFVERISKIATITLPTNGGWMVIEKFSKTTIQAAAHHTAPAAAAAPAGREICCTTFGDTVELLCCPRVSTRQLSTGHASLTGSKDFDLHYNSFRKNWWAGTGKATEKIFFSESQCRELLKFQLQAGRGPETRGTVQNLILSVP